MRALHTKLIELLMDDSRLSVTELAEKTKTSRKRVKETIERLIDRGIIKRFTIELGESDQLPYEPVKAMFSIRMKTPSCKQLYADIKNYEGLAAVYSVSSAQVDMIVIAEGRDMKAIERLRDKIAPHPLIQTMHTNALLNTWKDHRTREPQGLRHIEDMAS